MTKPTIAHALCLAAALTALPVRAQGSGPDAAAFQRATWTELGELGEGMTLSISDQKYREGTMLTFALKTEFATGDNAATVDVIELDCAATRFRTVSATTTRRNGEMTGSNEPGPFDSYPPESVIGQIAGGLCERVTAAGAAEH